MHAWVLVPEIIASGEASTAPYTSAIPEVTMCSYHTTLLTGKSGIECLQLAPHFLSIIILSHLLLISSLLCVSNENEKRDALLAVYTYRNDQDRPYIIKR